MDINDDTMSCCCPLCCLGELRPIQLASMIVIWDIICACGWWIFNVVMVSEITWAPLIINFILFFLLGFVLIDVRKGFGKFYLAIGYLFFRVFFSLFLVCAVFAFFIMIFVFWSNPSWESEFVGKWFSFWFVMIFLPESIILWGSNWSYYKAVTYLREVGIDEYTSSKTQNNSTSFGGFSGAPSPNTSQAFRV